eukprot:TRINITY_DN1802_c0_g1_i1.p2 TRINITY_DN1802_c0_g1~~TRINITY_DN1802_c0_g1_i1.p2  ORF type:complete len:111 (-),score=25.31 TRINITY_DN1802_c0_g1_i1:790-1122(-)
MRAFINQENIDFSTVTTISPVQEWELAEDVRGELEYPTRYARFQGVSTLTLHFPTTVGGGDTSRIHFIGLKGEGGMVINRGIVTNVVYEAVPRPEDNRVLDETGAPPTIL